MPYLPQPCRPTVFYDPDTQSDSPYSYRRAGASDCSETPRIPLALCASCCSSGDGSLRGWCGFDSTVEVENT